MEDKRIRLLRDEPVSKAVNRMSLPAIIGLLVMAVYNIVDTMFVAWLGTEATGATQVVFPIMMLISSFGFAFGIGGGSYISRLLGSKEYDMANKVATVSIGTTFILGALFTVFGLVLLEPLLVFFGASDSVMSMSKDYGLFIILGAIFAMSNMTLNNMLRGEGSAKISMIGQAVGAVLNIILDPILIFVLDWGIAGAAIATSFSQFVTFIILMSRYLRHHSVAKISIKFFKPSKDIYKEILKIGIPTFFRQMLVSISLGILNNGAVIHGGDDLLAAVGLVFKVYMMPMYVLFGIGQGFLPVVGYNFGAKNKERVIDTLKYGIRLSFIIAVISCTFLMVFPRAILSIFKPDESVMAYGIKGLRYYSLVMIFLAFTNSISIFYQAIGKGKESLVLAITRQGLLLIPLIYILPIFLGSTGILSAQFVADILTFVIAGLMFYRFIKRREIDEAMAIDKHIGEKT